MSIFTEYQIPQWNGVNAGTLKVNINTIEQIKTNVLQQAQATTEQHIAYLEASILESGYNGAYPIILNEEYRTADGYGRLKAICSIVERDPSMSFIVPFILGDAMGKGFNGSTRGVMDKDLERIFSGFEKCRGFYRGKTDRAREQAEEAAEFLAIRKYGTHSLVKTKTTEQQLKASIQKNEVIYRKAFIAVCQIANELGYNPEAIKFSHWLALFCRFDVTEITLHIARSNVIENNGSTESQRAQIFHEMADKAELGGL